MHQEVCCIKYVSVLYTPALSQSRRYVFTKQDVPSHQQKPIAEEQMVSLDFQAISFQHHEWAKAVRPLSQIQVH